MTVYKSAWDAAWALILFGGLAIFAFSLLGYFFCVCDTFHRWAVDLKTRKYCLKCVKINVAIVLVAAVGNYI